MFNLDNKIVLGASAVAMAALFWSLDGTFLRPQLYSLPSTLVVFLEHVFGAVLMAPFLFFFKSQLKTITKSQWIAIFWVALFGGALGTTFFTKALFLTGFTDISVVILLQKLQPVFAIVLASVFLKERFVGKFYIYAVVAMVAGYFVTFSDWAQPLANLTSTTATIAGLALLAAFAWGSATVFGKYSLQNIHHGLLTALRFIITSILMLLPAFYYYSSGFALISDRHVHLFIFIALTSGSVAMFLYYFGLKKIPASVATLAELAWPVSAIGLDYFVNGNILSLTQILGSVVLVGAVLHITRLHSNIIK